MLPSLASVRRAATRYCTVSLKSLALWRIFIGAAGIYSVAMRWPYASLLYSETGLYAMSGLGKPSWIRGPLAWLSSGFAIHAAFALVFSICLAFLVGFGMRVVRYLLLPGLWMLETRVPLTACGAEGVLHLQAFYFMALPTAEVWSVDSWLRSKKAPLASQNDAARDPAKTAKPDTLQNDVAQDAAQTTKSDALKNDAARTAKSDSVQSPFYALLLLQLATIYAFACICKYGPSWRDGTAAAHALNLINFISPFGAAAAKAPQPLLKLFSYGTLATEGTLPLLLLSPWARKKTHLLAGAMMIGLHGGIALTMDVGIWGTAMCCFLPLLWHPREEQSASVVFRSVRWRAGELIAVLALVYLGGARLGRDIFMLQLPRLPLPHSIDVVTQALQLSQPWMMFSPHPATVAQILVVDATTASGRHFDPWHREALGSEEVVTHVPIPALRTSVFNHYEAEIAVNTTSPLHYDLSRWIFAQRPSSATDDHGAAAVAPSAGALRSLRADDPVTRFDAWTFLVSTSPGYLVPTDELESRVGVLPLPAMGQLPVTISDALGVWAPERAIDGKVVPNGTHVFTPVSASMSAGCPHLTLDLGSQRALESAFVQADAMDEFIIEGSADGNAFHRLGEVTRVRLMHHLARVVPLDHAPVRYVRVKPLRSGSLRHFLSEIALFDHVASLPSLPSVKAETDTFYTSIERPAVAGVFSVNGSANPACPAEAPRHQPTQQDWAGHALSPI